MLIANAAFDRVQGAQFRSLINGIADRIWRSEGGRNNPHNTSAAQRRLDALAIAVGLQPPPPATTARTATRTGHANPAPRNPERGPRNQPAAPTTGPPEPQSGPTEPSGGTQPEHRRGEPVARTSQHPQTARTADAASAASGSPDNGPAPPTTTATQPGAPPTAGPTEPSGGPQPQHRRGELAARTSQHPQTARTATNGNATRDGNTAGAASAAGDDPDDGPAASGARDDHHRRTGPNPRPPTPDGQPSALPQPEPLPPDRQAAAPGRPPTTQNRQPVPPQPEPPPDRQPVSPQLEPPPDRQPSPAPRSEPAAPPATPDRQPVSPRLEPPAPPATPDRQFESPRHQVVIVASADVVSGQDPHGRCEIPGVGPIPQSELERLACDAELFGLLFSGKGEPLWHGRAKRTVTDAQRRALIARDGGCVLCAEEPARCEAHHITPWAKPNNGPTDIDNLALLCGACHRRLHNHKRVLTRNPDGTWATTPDHRHTHKRVLTRNPDGAWATTPDHRHTHTGCAPPGPATLDPEPA